MIRLGQSYSGVALADELHEQRVNLMDMGVGDQVLIYDTELIEMITHLDELMDDTHWTTDLMVALLRKQAHTLGFADIVGNVTAGLVEAHERRVAMAVQSATNEGTDPL